MKKLLARKRLSVPLGLVAAYLLLGFLAVGPLLRAQLLQRLPPLLHRPVAIEQVAFNPLTLALTVRGALVTEPGGEALLGFEELVVDVAGTDLVRGVVGFDEIRLLRPRVGLGLAADGRLSIADLLEPGPAAPPAPPEPGPARVVRVARLNLTEGAFTFTDASRPTPYRAELQPLTFELTDFSTEPGAGGAYRFNARVGGTQLRWDGTLATSPLLSKGQFAIEGLELAGFGPYLQGRTRLRLAGGKATLTSHYALAGSDLSFQDLALALEGLAIQGPAEARPLVALERLEVKARSVDLAARAVALEAVRLAGGRVDLRRLPDGSLELATLAGPGGASAPPPPAPPAPAPAWRATLPALEVEHLQLDWHDGSLRTPAEVSLQEVSLRLTDLALPLARPLGVALGARLGKGGLRASGTVGLSPLDARLEVELQDLPLEPLWPYAREAVELELTDGAAGLKGQVQLREERVSASGDLHLDGLRLEDRAGRPLLTAARLEAQQVQLATAPVKVEARTLGLTGARLLLELDPQGQPALARALRPPAPGTPPPSPPGPPPAVAVGLVRLDEVRLDLLDRSVSPPGAVSLQRLAARLRNVTHPRRSLMPLELSALVDGAPLAVKGSLKPAGPESLADLQVTLGGYELPLATPYAVKYVAQPIQKGKLSLELGWKVAEHRLEASNHLKVDQLDFGDRVSEPGPDAANLPLGLAVAILSDRTGLIDLQVPMEGDLADPSFGWLQVVVSALRNILEKVATAPFSLLAGLVEGDPEALKTVAFPPGEGQPASAERGKLDALTGVLVNRPALKVALTPRVDAALDLPALTRKQLRASLASRLDVDGGAAGLEETTWRRWVLEAYRGLRPDAGVPEPAAAEQAVLEARAVGPDQLEALRRERAEAVRAGLTADGGVSEERVFLAFEDLDAGTGQAAVTVDLK